jgi:hypothetical protein
MSRLKDEIRECQRAVDSFREKSYSKHIPAVFLSVRESKEDGFYGIFLDYLNIAYADHLGGSPLVWGFKARKGSWFKSYVDSCNFGSPDTNCAKTFSYTKAKEIAFSKARKLAGIISRRTSAPIILEERA